MVSVPMSIQEELVLIPADGVELQGNLSLPQKVQGLVIFTHGSGSGRLSPRNRLVASSLWQRNLGSVLFDLLTEDEATARNNVFDIELLAQRLLSVTQWAATQERTRGLPLGYFGASTGAAAALLAATRTRERIAALVSRGGRPDLAMASLPLVKTPTLLIVGSLDYPVTEFNERAYARLQCEKDLRFVQGAGHLFEGPGELQEVVQLAGDWFSRYLPAALGTGHRVSPSGPRPI